MRQTVGSHKIREINKDKSKRGKDGERLNVKDRERDSNM